MSIETDDSSQSTEDTTTTATDSSMELSDETLESVAGGVTVDKSLQTPHPNPADSETNQIC
jgi:hypothetical protein